MSVSSRWSPYHEKNNLAAGGQDPVDERVGAGPVGVPEVVVDAVARRGGEIEALVEDVASGEGRADEVPGEAEQGGPLLGPGALGAVEELVDQRPERGVVELAAARRGQEIVAADEHDDLVHPRKPRGQQRPHRREGAPVGEPHPVSHVSPVLGREEDRAAGDLDVVEQLP